MPKMKKWTDYQVNFKFTDPPYMLRGRNMLQLVDAGYAYEKNEEEFSMKHVNLNIKNERSRIAIVGDNGSGKSTLMKLLSGDIEPTQGYIQRSRGLIVGKYSQHFETLAMDVSPVRYLLDKFPFLNYTAEQMRRALGRFGLDSHAHLTPINKLSGGQKARVALTAVSLIQPHIILLDEPTNHLDMESIDALSVALKKFNGVIVIISHDAYLMEDLCTEVWVVEKGTVKISENNFAAYRDKLRKQIVEEKNF